MHLLLIETLALVGGTVHTMEPGAAPLAGATVLIEDGRIVAVGEVDVPEGAEVLDVAGLHVMPGLIDAAAGFDAEHDVLYLDSGVTAVHDSGSPTGEMLLETDGGMRDRNPGPTLLITSPPFSGLGSQRPGGFVLRPPAEAAAQIDEVLGLLEQANVRLTSFTLDRSLDPAQHAVAAGIGKELGFAVAGGLPIGLTPRAAAEQGHTLVTGLDSFLPPTVRFETLPEEFDLGEVAARVADSGLAVAPLLMGTRRVVHGATADAEPPALRALADDYAAAWRAELEMFRLLGASGEGLARANASFGTQQALVSELFKAGVPLVAASGAASPGIAPGAGLVDELIAWADSGVPVRDVLSAATVGTARALGQASERGRVAAGLVADLTILGADPSRSLTALRSPELVVLRGRVLERFELDELRGALEARQEAARLARNAPLRLPAPPMPEGEVVLDGTMDLIGYGTREAVERYRVVELEGGRRAFGARIRVAPTGDRDALELLLVQILDGGLVQRFELILNVLDENGRPRVDEEGRHAFHAVGERNEANKHLGVERKRFGEALPHFRSPTPVAAIEGSSALFGLVAALNGRQGRGYFLEFDGLLMEPVVDAFEADLQTPDGRIQVADARGLRVWGFGADGSLLFGARAERGGRLDFVPGTVEGGAPSKVTLPEGRAFTGDAKNPFGAAPGGAAAQGGTQSP
ncbi:MAG: hypothetical protein AAFR54_22495, partial [Planctomycetota bacterium]